MIWAPGRAIRCYSSPIGSGAVAASVASSGRPACSTPPAPDPRYISTSIPGAFRITCPALQSRSLSYPVNIPNPSKKKEKLHEQLLRLDLINLRGIKQTVSLHTPDRFLNIYYN